MQSCSEPTQLKREQIYEAAVAEFLDKGFLEASMDRISARAGASKRTVYKHFESKENLFAELINRHWARLAATFEITYDPNQAIRDQLVALGMAQGALLSSPEVMRITRLVMSEMLRQPELVEENHDKTDYKSAFERMLQDAAAAGVLQIDDPYEAADEFISLIKGKAFWPVIFLGAPVVSPSQMRAIVERSADMIMARYGA